MICNKSCIWITKIDCNFENHVENVHNPWTYMFYLSSLHEKSYQQLTGTEKYIYTKLQKKMINWIPTE